MQVLNIKYINISFLDEVINSIPERKKVYERNQKSVERESINKLRFTLVISKSVINFVTI